MVILGRLYVGQAMNTTICAVEAILGVDFEVVGGCDGDGGLWRCQMTKLNTITNFF